MTGKAVFGHNLFSDLEPEEFQEQFLTGYRGPRVDEHKDRSSFVENASPRGVVRRYKSEEMEPPHSVSVHSSIQRKLDEHIEQDASAHGANYDDFKSKYYQYKKKYANDCDWYVHLHLDSSVLRTSLYSHVSLLPCPLIEIQVGCLVYASMDLWLSVYWRDAGTSL
jgi:hypothetical protein